MDFNTDRAVKVSMAFHLLISAFMEANNVHPECMADLLDLEVKTLRDAIADVDKQAQAARNN